MTQPAAVVGQDAILSGVVASGGLPSTVWFEWGFTGEFEQRTVPVDVDGSQSIRRVQAVIPPPPAGLMYRCRIALSNASAVVYGGEQRLTAGGRVVAWGDSSSGQLLVTADLSNAVAVAAGNYHSLALRVDGTVAGWGHSSGWMLAPSDLTNAVAVACGAYHNLAILSDGSVRLWGQDDCGQLRPPSALGRIMAIAGGGCFSLAVSEDGGVSAWGDNSYGQLNVPVGVSNVVAVAAGWIHGLALRVDGTVIAWGDNTYGQSSVPEGLTNVVSVGAGAYTSFAVRKDGTVAAWGTNSEDQTTLPPGLDDAVAVGAGYLYGLALRTDGTTLMWGYHGGPTVPDGLSNVVAIAGGHSHFLAIGNRPPVAEARTVTAAANHDLVIAFSGSDPEGDLLSYRITSLPAAGRLYQCAEGLRGDPVVSVPVAVQDALGRVVFVPEPDAQGNPYAEIGFLAHDGRVDSPRSVLTINITGRSCATTQLAFVTETTNLWLNAMVTPNGFASRVWFEWGPGADLSQVTPASDPGSGPNVRRVSALLSGLPSNLVGQFRVVISNSVAVTHGAKVPFSTGRRISSWGTNSTGQSVLPQGLGPVVGLSSRYQLASALKLDGTVAVWGTRDAQQTNVPSGVDGVIALATGAGHVLALRSDGEMVAWGDNSFGQTSIPSGLGRVVALAAGPTHSVALEDDGDVVAWGDNEAGQTLIPSGLRNVVAIAAGRGFSVALRSDGTVIAWGSSVYGSIAVPPGLSNVVAIAAGDDHGLALTARGTVVGWGRGDSGQTRPPTAATNLVAVAAGSWHSLALREDGVVLAWGDNRFLQCAVPAELQGASAIAGGTYHSLAAAANRPPASLSTATYGYVNHDLVVPLSASDPNRDVLKFRVLTLPAIGALYQYVAGGRGDPVLQASTWVSDPLGQLVFVPAEGGLGGPYDLFSFVANDGEWDSALAVAACDILLPPQPRFRTSVGQPDGTFTVRLQGQSNATFRILASTNLVEWVDLGRAGATTPGFLQLTDSNAPAFPARFYRATAP